MTRIISLKIDEELLDRIDLTARKRNLSRNAFIISILEDALERLDDTKVEEVESIEKVRIIKLRV